MATLRVAAFAFVALSALMYQSAESIAATAGNITAPAKAKSGTFKYKGVTIPKLCLFGVPPACGNFYDIVTPRDLIMLQKQNKIIN